MSSIKTPSLWLIILIVGLPQLSETAYSPALPDIARSLNTTDTLAEYTLTIYLFGFALGTLFWGRLSDKHGRKPCMLGGLFLFLMGCVGCYFSTTIEMLMLSRLLQSFGGSVGSVLGQAICRDVFHGQALGKMYATIGTSLSIFPALGPVVGGVIDQNFGWSAIFLFLIVFAVFVWGSSLFMLNETHPVASRNPASMGGIAKRMLRDKHVLICGLLVAGCNGITFSYYAEAPFFLIELLGLSPSAYGITFLGLSGAGVLGGVLSRTLHNRYASVEILGYGLWILCGGVVVFAGVIASSAIIPMPQHVLIGITIILMSIIMLGISMTTTNALSISLKEYRNVVGTASSLFGFGYYGVISFFTLGMGGLHNDTLYPMPLYFLGIVIVMMIAFRQLQKE